MRKRAGVGLYPPEDPSPCPQGGASRLRSAVPHTGVIVDLVLLARARAAAASPAWIPTAAVRVRDGAG